MAFDRVTLAPGESKTVTLPIAPRAFQYWAVEGDGGKWQTVPGTRTVQIGTSAGDMVQSAELP